MNNLFVFMGPPGSGKGSLSQYCIEKFGWRQLSTGALCRKHIAEQTEIGRQIDFDIKSGKLISDDVMCALVEEWLVVEGAQQNTVILDGFPRTVLQANLLSELIKRRLPHYRFSVIHFLVNDDVVIKRLGSRTVCSNKDCQAIYSSLVGSMFAPRKEQACDRCDEPLVRRSDDETYCSIQERLQTYHRQAAQLLDFYKNAGFDLHELNGESHPERVFQAFEKSVMSRPHDYYKK